MQRRHTKFEKTKLIGIRAKQIENGSLAKCPVSGLTSSIDIATKEYEMGFDLETEKFIPLPTNENNEENICKHTHLGNIDGNVFCEECGLFERYELMNELCIDFEYHARIREDKTEKGYHINDNLNEHSKVKELREAATKLGVKCVTMMSKKQLCEALGIKISNEGKYVLKNLKTGEEHRLKNQKEIHTKFNVYQGSISFLLGKNVTIGEDTYSLEKKITVKIRFETDD